MFFSLKSRKIESRTGGANMKTSCLAFYALVPLTTTTSYNIPDRDPELLKNALSKRGTKGKVDKLDSLWSEALVKKGFLNEGESLPPSDAGGKPVIVRHATKRKRWGIENGHPREYWYNPIIHSLGNTGPLGRFHALCAPIATYVIDNAAYSGRNIREEIAGDLKKRVVGENPRVLDMCCGVGMSTRALAAKMQDAEAIIGLDTSPEMISMAKFQSALSNLNSLISDDGETSAEKVSTYVQGNAEKTNFSEKSFDLVTIMYAFHEAPAMGRYMILREARRLLKHGGMLALVDISPDYTPR